MARFQEFEVRNDQIAAGGDVGHEDHLKDPLNSGVVDLPDEERVPKARKPYTISKQREKWTEDEHKLFLESLKLHGRAWRRIQEHIGSKTAVQIRSHAQKFFSKVTRESTADGNGVVAAPRIRIPPPRPKRKPTHPYPRKLGNSPGKGAPYRKQLDKPQLQVVPSSYEQENDSPKSVLTRAQVVRSPASSVGAEDRCSAQRIAAVEVATQVPPYKVYNGDSVSKHSNCGIPESPVLRLFGKRVVVNGLHQQPTLDPGNQQNVADMELDATAETSATGTEKLSSCGAAEANTLSPYPTDKHQFMYYLPQGKVLFVPSDCQFFSYNNGSMDCTVSNPHSKQQQNQPSQAADCRFRSGEGSCTESITTSSSVPETRTQNSESVDSMQVLAYNEEDEVIPVPGSRKCVNPNQDSLRGFVPYKKYNAEREMVQSQTDEVQADREMTRLCL